jgi:dTDP-4-dehydrorhamnose reductase
MAEVPHNSGLEIWGGVECSVVRTTTHTVDQIALSGHDRRAGDLALFAELGLRTLRFPILWERHAGHAIDWSWADARMEQMRRLGMKPIVGLLHHGCGPLADGFLAADFVEGLAGFAREVARRYPWVDAYTPVNEPLTTARFGALYGIWHPFATDPAVFGRALMNEYEATRSAMAAIRGIRPDAQLVQTEDVGKTHSTPLLAYQADWENERRWLTYDLLAGRLTPDMPLWHYLRYIGVPGEQLASFRDAPCPPAIAGMNHYVTSERFLDDRTQRYPPEYAGGNGRHSYTDIPAVRVRAEGAVGPATLLREMWQRLRLPIAITEVQLACTREEQLRWLYEVWSAAGTVRDEGADIRAVTAWALLGAYDWDSLLLKSRGNYENGAFDVQSGSPRPTAIAHALRSLAATGTFAHPVLETAGWWRRPARFTFAPVSAPRTGAGTAVSHNSRPLASPIVFVGLGGAEGDEFARLCDMRGLTSAFWDAEILTRWDASLWARNLPRSRPWALVVQRHESAPRDMIDALAEICAAQRIVFLEFNAESPASHEAASPCVESTEGNAQSSDRPRVDTEAPAALALSERVNAALDDLVDRYGT